MKLIIEEKEFNLLLDESSNIIAAVLELPRCCHKIRHKLYSHDRLLKIKPVTNKFISKCVKHYCNFTATQVPLGSFRQ